LLPTSQEVAAASQHQALEAQHQVLEAQRQAQDARDQAAALEALLARYRERFGQLPE
jgi:hypothetical protein